MTNHHDKRSQFTFARLFPSVLCLMLLGTVGPAESIGGPFDMNLDLQGVSFRVSCQNDRSLNMLHIVPSGLSIDNSPIAREIDGFVHGAEVADLNADGSPEIYIYVTSAGSGSYGMVVAYSANRKKSLSEIYFPSLTEDEIVSMGYMGHDEFTVGEGALLHRFPIYQPGDTNANSTGGMRQVQYRLTHGEAGWVLKRQKP